MKIIRKMITAVLEEFLAFHFRLQLVHLVMGIFPPYTAYRIRTALLRLIGFSIGANTAILGMPRIVGPRDLYSKMVIGKNCLIGPDCYLDIGGNIIIGDNVDIGPESMIITGTHQIGPRTHRLGPLQCKDVEIGKGTWLGARCTILPGVRIGEGVVVAAGAVVTKDTPDNVLVGGVPAKIIRELCSETEPVR